MNKHQQRRLDRLIGLPRVWHGIMWLTLPASFRNKLEALAIELEALAPGLSPDDIEDHLFTLENLRYQLIAGGYLHTATHAGHIAKLRRKGFDTANSRRTTKAAARWNPWRDRWNEFQREGIGPDSARAVVGAEIKLSGAWWGKGSEPSRSALKRNLK